jgi:hypothetical protein
MPGTVQPGRRPAKSLSSTDPLFDSYEFGVVARQLGEHAACGLLVGGAGAAAGARLVADHVLLVVEDRLDDDQRAVEAGVPAVHDLVLAPLEVGGHYEEA